jgi:hypothetical protein
MNSKAIARPTVNIPAPITVARNQNSLPIAGGNLNGVPRQNPTIVKSTPHGRLHFTAAAGSEKWLWPGLKRVHKGTDRPRAA